MSDIPRYKPVANDKLGIADDADGKLCEYRHYEQLKSTIQSFAQNVLRLGYEVRDLAKERDALKEHIRYLEIELTTETARWERAMQEYERLRASSFVTAVPVEEYEKLKAENERLRTQVGADAIDRKHGMCCDSSAEVERLRKAGDAMLGDYKETGVIFPPSEDAWNAAKDGKPTE